MRLSSILRAWSARLVGALRRGRGGAENGRERPLSAREVALAKVQAQMIREGDHRPIVRDDIVTGQQRYWEASRREREKRARLVAADDPRYTPGMAAPHRKTNREDT